MRRCALVPDLLDRSRLAAALADIEFVRDVEGCEHADVVVVDLARHGDLVSPVRAALPKARIVGFGPHVDDAALERARAAGADVVYPRSRFFRDVAAAIAAS
jgi:hypothetical protein